jgi:hypothetical protein
MSRARDVADVQDNLGGAVPPFVAGKNFAINGGFDIWQRGTSISVSASTNTAISDRWNYLSGSTSTVSRQSVSDTTNLPTLQYCARVQRNSGQTSTSPNYLATSLETSMSIPLSGQVVTVSFYARAGANFSSTSNILTAILQNGTGTDQNLFAYTGSNTIVQQNKTLTTAWQRFTMTSTVPANSTELSIYFTYNPTGTAGTNDFFEITGVQLERGALATPFARAGGTIQGELAACQRYYWRNTATNANGAMVPSAFAYNATTAIGTMSCPVTMRTSPTVLETSGLNFRKFDDTIYAMSALTFDSSKTSPNIISIAGTIAGATAGWTGTVGANSNAAAYIGVGAEL